LLKEGQNNIYWDPLYTVVDGYIPKNVLLNKNRTKSWAYGYDKKNDIVIISKDGTLGEVMTLMG